MIKYINDLDHFNIIHLKKKNKTKELKDLQEFIIKSLGNKECLLQSDIYKEKKESIKFPFFKLE